MPKQKLRQSRLILVVGMSLTVTWLFALVWEPRAQAQAVTKPGTAKAQTAAASVPAAPAPPTPPAEPQSKPLPKREPMDAPPETLETPDAVIRGSVEVRKMYQISLGPWSTRFSVPENFDLLDLADRARGALGILLILGVAVFLSDNRRAISPRVVFWGLTLQLGFGLLVLRVPAGVRILSEAGTAVESILGCALAGAEFLFGKPLVDPKGPAQFVFAFRVLPTVVFVASLFAVLYHMGVMQWVVRAFAFIMARLMGTSGAESLNVAASLFLGQTEAPLTIRPYLLRLTNSELLTVMTSGMAHVSGGVMAAYFAYHVEPRHILTAVIMTAPGAILLSKILVPETGVPETLGKVSNTESSTDANLLDAAARGTRDGLHLALNIGAILIAFLGLIALTNMALAFVGHSIQGMLEGLAPRVAGTPVRAVLSWANHSLDGISLQSILGWAMAPVAYLLGVPWEDIRPIGSLLGTRTVINELVAFQELGELKSKIMDRSFVIASFALCGFANFSSIGIQLGGIGALVPERRHDLARLGVRALLAGTLANYLSACIAGILL
jgi:CNT family concentrative nucleoside transporter